MPISTRTDHYADDAPLTAKELRTARRLGAVKSDLATAIIKSRGRPLGRTKEAVHLSLDADLVRAMRASGRGPTPCCAKG